MSWEAVTWANRQKLKKSYEQIVLLVLANCADPNGEAFIKWPGREHWWVYLSERTRLPKSSLFRHLNTLVALGLGERTMQVLADGSRRPTFRLNMEASFDIEIAEDAQRYHAAFARASAENQSPVGTEEGEGADDVENDSDISHSQGSDAPISPQSPVETGGNHHPSLRPETEPFPVLGLHKDSKLVSKDSPLPPSGGAVVRDELWDQFVSAWGEPIPKMAIARHAWEHIATEKRGEAVAAAKGYFAWLKAHPKPPATQSAQSFLRDVAGWAQWLRYTPDASGQVQTSSSFSVSSREGRAIAAIYEIAGKGAFFHGVMVRHGTITFLRPITPRMLALADAPPKSEWVHLEKPAQAWRWDELVAEAVGPIARQKLAQGAPAPWPWPPNKDGTLSPTGPPPDTLMTERDVEDFT